MATLECASTRVVTSTVAQEIAIAIPEALDEVGRFATMGKLLCDSICRSFEKRRRSLSMDVSADEALIALADDPRLAASDLM